MTEDIAAFIKARLDEDEAAAKPATQGGWRANGEDVILVSDDPHWDGTCIASAGGYDGEHIARHDPARVLREVAAIRTVIALTQEHMYNEEDTLRAFASIWSDHPDYRAEWKP